VGVMPSEQEAGGLLGRCAMLTSTARTQLTDDVELNCRAAQRQPGVSSSRCPFFWSRFPGW
jgi:hypothetical protein